MDYIDKRSKIIYYIIIVTFIIISINLFNIQIIQSKYKIAGENNAIRFESQQSARGIIFDRNGKEIAINIPSDDLMVIPREIKKLDTNQLCQLTKINKYDLIKKIEKGIEFSAYKEVLIGQIDPIDSRILKEKLDEFPGFYIRTTTKRKYAVNVAAHLIGFLGEIKVRYQHKLKNGMTIVSNKKTVKENDVIFILSNNKLDSLEMGEYETVDNIKFQISKKKYIKNIPNKNIRFPNYINYKTNKKIDDHFRKGDLEGKTGIEYSYDEFLRGSNGIKLKLFDALNRSHGSFSEGKHDTLAIKGNDLITTLDIELQKYGEQLMRNKIGSVVAIEPTSGEILTMISSPNYNPNIMTSKERSRKYDSLLNHKDNPLFNRSLAGMYPPASPFKLINSLIALEENTINHTDIYYCTGGYEYGNSKTLKCHKHNAPTNMKYAITVSCNTYFCNLWEKYFDKYPNKENAYNNWIKHVESFGLGKRFNSDFNVNSAGLLPTISYLNKKFYRWNSSTLLNMSIGQGDLLVTPIQMANIAAIIANKGYYFTPHLVKNINENGIYIDIKKNYTTISSKHFNKIINGMTDVMEKSEGTAQKSKVENLNICGKTGTAQNPHGEDHSTFIAFAPKENPKIAIAVYVENGGAGSEWAAPIGALIIEKYMKKSVSNKNIENKIMKGVLVSK
ncbi:MAG: hypothetical protein CMP51_04040 [Flavobacteriales bacterium]|nr:hypothetical protein [Flavobacteriales bacterium]